MPLSLPNAARPVVGLMLALGLSIAEVVAAPLGPVTPVTAIHAAFQSAPEVAVNNSGASVVVWQEDETQAVFAQRFAADGSAVGEPIRVDARPDNRRDLAPDVALADDGRFVVVWQRVNAGLPEGPTQNFIRRFAANGTPLAAAQALDQAGPFQLIGVPSLAGDGSGNHAVVWSRFTTTERNGAVILPRYYDNDTVRGVQELVIEHRAADGSLRAPQQVADAIDTVTRDGQFVVGSAVTAFGAKRRYSGYDVTMNAAGEAAVSWTDDREYEGSIRVVVAGSRLAERTVNLYARRYAANASAAGDRITVSSLTTAGRIATERSAPRIGLDRQGAMTAAWADLPYLLGLRYAADNYVRRVDADGRLRPRAKVGVSEGFLVQSPVIAALDDGRALVAFVQGGTLDIVTQVVDAGGQASGAAVEVADSVRVDSPPVIAAQGSGAHIVAWSVNGVVYLRRYGAVP